MQVFWFSYAELTFAFFIAFTVVTFSLLALRMCCVHCCDFYTPGLLFSPVTFPTAVMPSLAVGQSLPISLAQH